MLTIDILEQVEDPRDYNTPHALTDILFVALAAMLCGAVHCTDMAAFAEARLELLRQFVPLKGGAPSHDTFSRVLRALDPQAFNAAFARFMTAFGAQARLDTRGHLAIDGKSLRRAYDKGRAHMPPLVVTVFACESFVSLAQTVAQAGGEAQAAIEALDLLSLKGCTVTADALHCHRRTTQAIVSRGGDCVLAVKGNQSKLAKEATAALDKAAARPRNHVHETDETAHGRHEVRRAFVTPFVQTPGKAALVGLKALARIETWRTVGEKTSHAVRTYALSRKMVPEELLRTVRRHWAIENQLHWQLDVLMAEDQTRSRKDTGPANLALVRQLSLNVLRARPGDIPLRQKAPKARWKEADLLQPMTHVR